MSKRNRVDLLLVLTLAGVLAVEYSLLVESHTVDLRLPLQEQIISGTAPSPYRYRVLVPWVGEALTRLVPLDSLPLRHRVAYAVYDFVALFFTLGTLFLYLRRWMSLWPARAALFYVAATMPTTFRNHVFQPWSLLEPGLFALALLWILDRKRLRLAGLVLVAAFNRETAVFLPTLYLVTRGGEGRAEWRWAGLYYLIWAGVFAGLRGVLGNAPHVITLAESLRFDLTPKALALTAINLPLFLGPVPIFAVLGYRRADPFLRRASWIVPAYVLCAYTFAYWLEVRLLMSMYALVIPLAWVWLMSLDDGFTAKSPSTGTQAPGEPGR